MSVKLRFEWKPNCVAPTFLFRYEPSTSARLDGDRLLESSAVGDNVIAILARLRDHKEAVRKIVERIAGLPAPSVKRALGQLLVLSGLRHLEESVEQEARKMPILECILDNKVLGREYKRGLQEGELTVLRRQMENDSGRCRAGRRNAWQVGRRRSWKNSAFVCSMRQSLEDLLK